MQEIEATIKHYEAMRDEVKKTGLNNDYDSPIWVKQLTDFKNRVRGDVVVKGISFYRMKKEGKEYLYYHRELQGKNHVGNKITAYQPGVGTQDRLEIQYTYSEDGARRPSSNDFVMEYLLPFSKATAEKLIKEGTTDEPNFYVKDSAFRFAVDMDEFLTGRFEDVVKSGKGKIVKRMKTEASEQSE